MINEQKLTKDIMARVQTVYYGQLLARPAFELAVLLSLVYIAKTLVFWQAAVFNMSHLSITGWLGYALGAFWQTEVVVKLALVGGVLFGLKFIFDLIRTAQFLSIKKISVC